MRLAVALVLAALTGTASAGTVDASLHARLLTLDTHLDTPMNFARPGWSMLDRHKAPDDINQVDYPRMVQGNLSGGFFVIFTDQGPLTPAAYAAARDGALQRAVEIREMVARNADKFELAFTPDDALRIHRAQKRIVFQSIENSYPIGEDLSLLETFHRFGVRMAGPVHFKNNQFGDSATDKPQWHGLSPLGLRWVEEMNRLGMIIDASHASDDVFDQLLERSRAPIILSHSGARAIFDHPRNIDDERLRKLAAKGGVLQVTAVYLTPMPADSPARRAIGEREGTLAFLSPAAQREFARDYHAQNARDGWPSGTFEQFMASLLHAIKVAGVDHVGIGADWDGGGGVKGMSDVSMLPKITAALQKAGYSAQDIEKIWSGNVLRVLREVEARR
ncbi:dipeptidase [Roseiterribacter gracilis]|uniref:Dipeptidase n=1 Tax=Roseiterribacter gracilis TaxID=2812848 RepID=A0A8S8X6Z6_9PROT|nr:dipeptidase [Rhodospirillales bacterium TMPK1]